MDSLFKRRIIDRLRRGVPCLSFYRMIRGRSFDELCRYYEDGHGISTWEQFIELAERLEATYAPPESDRTRSPHSG